MGINLLLFIVKIILLTPEKKTLTREQMWSKTSSDHWEKRQGKIEFDNLTCEYHGDSERVGERESDLNG